MPRHGLGNGLSDGLQSAGGMPRSGGSQVAESAPSVTLTREQRQAVHALLSKLDDLRHAARTSPPAQLLGAIMRSGLLTSLNPEKPPHGAKLLAEELTAGLGADGAPRGARQYADDGVGSTPQMTTGGMSTPGSQFPRTPAPRFASSQRAPPPSSAMLPPAGVPDRLGALKAFLEHSAISELEGAGAGGGGRPVGVTLSTIHGAKGREWTTVLLVRVNEETLPLTMPTDDEEGCTPEQLAEERRLLYVAMTRAKQRLMLSYVALGPDKVKPLPWLTQSSHRRLPPLSPH